jgi:hypothetical protein
VLFRSVLSTTTQGLSYQWYLNNTPIQGANNDSLTVQSNFSGVYNLLVTFAYGCAFSNNIAGLEESFDAYQIFPNPANKTLQIQGSDELQTYFQLLDVRGAVVLTGFINKSHNTIDIENIKNGTYLLQLESAPTSFFKVIIAH